MADNKVLLVTGSYDHTLIFWDAITGQCYHSIEQPEYSEKFIINRIEISLDKKWLGAACSNSIIIYDLETFKSKYRAEGQYNGNVTCIGFQKDSKWVYAGSEDGQVNVHDLRMQSYVRHFVNKDPINSVVLHPNEAELIAGDQMGNIKIFDLSPKNDVGPVLIPCTDDIGIRSLSMSLNAQLLVAADSAGWVHAYSLQNNDTKNIHFEQKFEAHQDYILKCQICPYTKKLATCSADKTIKLWSIDKQKIEKNDKEKKNEAQIVNNEKYTFTPDKTLYGHSKWVWDCAFSCDTDFLISCSSDQVAKIWRIDTGEAVRTLKGHKLALNDIEQQGGSEQQQ